MLQRRVDPVAMLAEVADALLSSDRGPESGLEAVCRLLCDRRVSDIAQVYVAEPNGVHLRAATTATRDPQAGERIRATLSSVAVRIDDSIAGRAARSVEPLLLTDIPHLDDYPFPAGYRAFFAAHDIRHLLAVRIRADQTDLGSLVVCRVGDSPPFGDDDVALLAGVAALASVSTELAALVARLRAQAGVLDQIGDAVIVVDEGQVVTQWNRAAEAIYGISSAEAIGTSLSALVSTVSHSVTDLVESWQTLAASTGWRDGVRQVTRDGRIVEIEAVVTPVVDGETGFAGAVAVNRDISARLRHERELAERQAFAEAVLDALPGRTCVVQADGLVRAVNSKYVHEGPFGEGRGSGPDVGADALSFLDLVAREVSGAGVLAADVRQALAGADPAHPVEVHRGDERWTECRAIPFLGPGGGALLTFVDVSGRKAHELELAHRATHDPLTELPNRALLIGRIQDGLARAERRAQHVAVLFVDLDNVKSINDELGHDAGDAVITEAAHRLSASCRSCDTVARVGGDEFVVVLEEIAHPDEAEQLAERILDRLATAAGGGSTPWTPGIPASVGVAVAPGRQHATTGEAEDLIRRSDTAMLLAKRAGKSRVVVESAPAQRRAVDPG